MRNWLQDEHNRAVLYRACLALIPLLVALDFVTGDVGDQLIRSAQVILGFGSAGLATKNTTRRPRHDISPEHDPIS